MKCMGQCGNDHTKNARFFLDLQFIPSAYPSRGTASRMRMLAAASTSIPNADDDAACPMIKDVCRKNAFLVPGDVVLTGRTQGAFTCVAYQSFHTRKQNWTTGWLPTSSLAPVEPIQSPKMADWIGSWSHPGGTISISRGEGGKLASKGNKYIPRRAVLTAECSGGGGARAKHDRFC